MLGNFIKRDEVDDVLQDVLIVLDKNGTADIVPVTNVNEERVLAHVPGEVEYSVPLSDTVLFVGRRGRIFHYPATTECISHTKNIAALERSTVLKQITMFEQEVDRPVSKMPIGKMLLIGAAVLILIILAVK